MLVAVAANTELGDQASAPETNISQRQSIDLQRQCTSFGLQAGNGIVAADGGQVICSTRLVREQVLCPTVAIFKSRDELPNARGARVLHAHVLILVTRPAIVPHDNALR